MNNNTNKSSLDKFLEFSILSLPLILLLRWVISQISSSEYLDISNSFEIVTYLILLILFILSIWQIFFRIKCPTCKSTSVNLDDSEEIDRYIKQKKVTETVKNSQGKVISSHDTYVPVTYVKINNTYSCNECNQVFEKIVTKEV